MEFERLPTVPTADEMLDRVFRRAAAKKKLKTNKDRANEEFVRAVASAVYDKLKSVVSEFPSFDSLPPFYREIADIIVSVDRMKKSLGAVTWAAEQSKKIGYHYALGLRRAEDSDRIRKQSVARISSIVHQVDSDLRFLNDARNALRKLPDIREEFTVVVAGYPNVGKSSFISEVTTADPEVAPYPFTTKGIIVGHRTVGRERIQFVDTPGLLDRPAQDRNPIERQALSAIINTADVILFLIDASEQCGYPLSAQEQLLAEIRTIVEVPVIVAVSKADIAGLEGYPNLSAKTGEGMEEVLGALLKEREATAMPRSLRSL